MFDGPAIARATALHEGLAVISIIDYGAGNLRSVVNALHAVDAAHQIVRSAPDVLRAGKILLPGVGHFGQMMRALDSMQVGDALVRSIRAGTPFLGICLGLQALFEDSEEAPGVAGLGILPGTVRRFRGDMRVPHMGWNEVAPCLPRGLPSPFGPLEARPHVYFAHSYYAPLAPSTAASCEYGGLEFSAAISQENVFAVQFHPEKSGETGQTILRNFAGL